MKSRALEAGLFYLAIDLILQHEFRLNSICYRSAIDIVDMLSSNGEEEKQNWRRTKESAYFNPAVIDIHELIEVEGTVLSKMSTSIT